MTAGATVVPALRYREAPAAIDFLCDVFGFERRLVVPGPEGTIAHAQLTIGGSGMVMLGSAGQSTYDQYVRAPKEAGGATMTCYVVVADPDAHYDRARKGGAEILREIEDQGYGGRDYTCRDPEGNVWTFGSYDPWASHAQA